MNRLQKKCFIVSLGIHLLLPAIFIVGSGFLNRPKPDLTPVDTFFAVKTIDEALSGGGDNTVKSPPAALVVPPTPPTPPAPVADRTPPPPEPKPVKVDPVPVEPTSHVHHIQVNTDPVVRNAADVKATRDAARAKEAADRRREADAVGHAIAGIRGGVSGSTEIKLQGPGGGGVPYGNFLSQVKRVYWGAWLVPDGSPDVTVRATVTIARDGTVVSARIVEQSGNAAVDNSVQMTLDRVTFVAPLPEGAKEDQRTVTINFNTETKLQG